MSLTNDQLKALFPRASIEFIRKNCSVGRTISYSELKPDKTAALGKSAQRKAEGASRIVVRFVGFRVKPLDPDNFAGSVKDLLDGLRYAHCIPGDEPWRITLETQQEKVSHYYQEKTEIELIYP